MKNFKQTLFIALFVLCFVPFSVHAAELNTPAANVDLNKSWTIHFNQAITQNTVNENTVYVLNSKNEKVAVSYRLINNNRSIVISPPASGYIPKQTYTLIMTDGVKNSKKSLKTSLTKPFTIAPLDRGIVITKQNGLTNLYIEPNLTTKAVSYVEINSAFEYIDSNATSIAINVAGATRYIAHQDARITSDLSMQNYYQVNGGELLHYIYNYPNKRFESYIAGKAPSFLKAGIKYTSTDGAQFTDASGKIVGESYNYFQHLSVRTPTTYTAAQLNAYIEQELARRNITNSKLTGIGTHLKQIEAEHQINALFLLAFAQHESAFGTSNYALKNNNLFGIEIFYDGAPSQNFATPQASVEMLVKDILNEKYIPANAGEYSNGVAPGNKYIGFNVSYAADPYWGAKIAGFMYTVDKALGSKDYQQYQIGLITKTPENRLNIRETPSTNKVALYFIRNPLGKPLTIIEEATSPWLKIMNDELSATTFAYASSDYVRIVPTH